MKSMKLEESEELRIRADCTGFLAVLSTRWNGEMRAVGVGMDSTIEEAAQKARESSMDASGSSARLAREVLAHWERS